MSMYVACYPVDDTTVPEEHRRAYAAVAEAGLHRTPYPGSVDVPCATCGVLVRVGPRQQRVVALGATVLCMFDAARLGPDIVTSLGNPDGRPLP